ncbi:MAG TPA: hypothetical protein VGS12_13460 [Caulobacteraceae bacterium]|nr:hypothetical protein [Caulobacteraceae bacterium]
MAEKAPWTIDAEHRASLAQALAGACVNLLGLQEPSEQGELDELAYDVAEALTAILSLMPEPSAEQASLRRGLGRYCDRAATARSKAPAA